jgi:hypothetical protein
MTEELLCIFILYLFIIFLLSIIGYLNYKLDDAKWKIRNLADLLYQMNRKDKPYRSKK